MPSFAACLRSWPSPVSSGSPFCLADETAGHIGERAVVVVNGQVKQRQYRIAVQRFDGQTVALQLGGLTVRQFVQHEVGAGQGEGQSEQLRQ